MASVAEDTFRTFPACCLGHSGLSELGMFRTRGQSCSALDLLTGLSRPPTGHPPPARLPNLQTPLIDAPTRWLLQTGFERGSML